MVSFDPRTESFCLSCKVKRETKDKDSSSIITDAWDNLVYADKLKRYHIQNYELIQRKHKRTEIKLQSSDSTNCTRKKCS